MDIRWKLSFYVVEVAAEGGVELVDESSVPPETLKAIRQVIEEAVHTKERPIDNYHIYLAYPDGKIEIDDISEFRELATVHGVHLGYVTGGRIVVNCGGYQYHLRKSGRTLHLEPGRRKV